MARREKQPVHKVVMTEGKRNIVHQLLEEYDIQTAEDIQEALKDLLGSTLKEMMEAEMDDHLGYEKSERSDSDDYRNGYKPKRINSFMRYLLMILYQKCTTFDRSFQNILTEAKSIRIVKVGGHDSHLPFSLTYHRRFQFTDFFSYPPLFQFATRSSKMTVCFKCYRESFGRHMAWRT